MVYDAAPAFNGLYAFLLVFARVGVIVMLMPGFGETWTPMRARFALAFGLSALISASGVMGGQQNWSDNFSLFLFAIIAECVTGFFLGGIMRLFLAAPAIAGQAAGQLTALSNIFTASGLPMQTSAVLGAWFLVGAVMFIFVSDLHYLMIDAVASSYALAPVGAFLDGGEMARQAVKAFGGIFILGVQMASPFILLGIAFNLGSGLINKMMVSMPIYFVMMPLAILGGLFVLTYAIGPMMIAFRGAFAAWLAAPL